MPDIRPTQKKIAVLLPCLNEEITIAQVVQDFQRVIPSAQVYVFDNCSTDRTSERARQAGATVVYSPKPGKGNTVIHMFDVVEADIYVMADGDLTYPAEALPGLLELFESSGSDMVVGSRLDRFDSGAFRKFHLFGNTMLAKTISYAFGTELTDILSGYRVFSRRLVKSLPLKSSGFEIETELTLQTLAKGFKIRETTISYGARPEGSFSKLNTVRDGRIVLTALFLIFKDFRPLIFFTGIGFLFFVLSALCGILPIADYLRERFVYHVPLAILAVGFGVLGVMSIAVGMILNTIVQFHRENFILFQKLLNK